jgi:hypothetical protein
VRAQAKRNDQDDAADVHLLFRQVNDRVRTLNEAFEPILAGGEWVCECADSRCVERIELSLAEYDAIRAHAGRFVALAGHDVSGADRIVERVNGYVIVEQSSNGAAQKRVDSASELP